MKQARWQEDIIKMKASIIDKRRTFRHCFSFALCLALLSFGTGALAEGGNGEETPQNPSTTYTITWKNWDDTTLEKDENVESGTMPTYDGKKPTKEPNEEYHYEEKYQ